jgi:uncharacterized protein with PQ loop repeat
LPSRINIVIPTSLMLSLTVLYGCQDLVPRDTQSLLVPRFQRSEIVGFLAGLGTTFAALPDLIAMLRRRSTAGMNPRMAAILGAFQNLWVYYGLLIESRPVIAWKHDRHFDQLPERWHVPLFDPPERLTRRATLRVD